MDADGMMVQAMRSGTSLQPGERAGCTGCHESRYDSPPPQAGALPQALRRAPSQLKPWYGPERDFNYLTEVQPVFDAHCVKCHDYGKEGVRALNLSGDLGLAFAPCHKEDQQGDRSLAPSQQPDRARVLECASWGRGGQAAKGVNV